jgi:ABC-type multidrug transport system fused ATPase/permease subunit
LASFRKYFGIVAQQSYFFNDTIRNNLLYGLDLIYDLTPEMVAKKEEEMRTYCKQLKLSKLIESLPKQYDTEMGD